MLGLGAVISPKAQSRVKHGSLETQSNTSSYLSIPITNSVFNSDHTISFWIKAQETDFSVMQMGYRHSSKDAASEYYIDLRATTIAYVHTSRGKSVYTADFDLRKADNRASKWYHIVCTQVSLSGTPQLAVYINGQIGANPVSSFRMDDKFRGIFSAASSFVFGGINISSDTNIDISNHQYKMRIANFSVWNVTMGSTAVSSLYNNGRGIKLHKSKGSYGQSGNLVLNYNFNSPSQDGTYKSTGSASSEVATAVGCKHVADHPFITKSERLQG